MNINHHILGIAVALGLSVSAQAQNFSTGIAAYEGTLLKDSSGNSWSNYTIQVGVFASPIRLDGGYWFSWDDSANGTNAGWTQIFHTTGILGSSGLLNLDADGYFATFNNVLPADTAYNSVKGLSPTVVFSRAASGSTREVLVASFTSALLGWDPDSIETENIFGLANDPDQTTFYAPFTGGASGSSGSTILTSAAVPEPSTATLLVSGLAALLALRRRKI
jgi:hypothetical protein